MTCSAETPREGSARRSPLWWMSRKNKESLTCSQRVSRRRKLQPRWLAGQGVAAMIEADRGRPERANAEIKDLLADKDRRFPQLALMAIARDLGTVAATREAEIAVYERAMTGVEARITRTYSMGPARPLAFAYARAGRYADARRPIWEYARRFVVTGNNLLSEQGTVHFNRVEPAMDFRELGLPGDSARVLGSVLADSALLGSAEGEYIDQQFVFRTDVTQIPEGYPTLLRRGLEQSICEFDASFRPARARRLAQWGRVRRRSRAHRRSTRARSHHAPFTLARPGSTRSGERARSDRPQARRDRSASARRRLDRGGPGAHRDRTKLARDEGSESASLERMGQTGSFAVARGGDGRARGSRRRDRRSTRVLGCRAQIRNDKDLDSERDVLEKRALEAIELCDQRHLKAAILRESLDRLWAQGAKPNAEATWEALAAIVAPKTSPAAGAKRALAAVSPAQLRDCVQLARFAISRGRSELACRLIAKARRWSPDRATIHETGDVDARFEQSGVPGGPDNSRSRGCRAFGRSRRSHEGSAGDRCLPRLEGDCLARIETRRGLPLSLSARRRRRRVPDVARAAAGLPSDRSEPNRRPGATRAQSEPGGRDRDSPPRSSASSSR